MLAPDRSFAMLGSARSGKRTGGPRVCVAPTGALPARTYPSDTLWFMLGPLPRTFFDSCVDIHALGTQRHSLLHCCIGRTQASTSYVAPTPFRPSLSGLRQAYPSFHPCPRTLDRRASPLSILNNSISIWPGALKCTVFAHKGEREELILNNSHGRCGTRHCA